MNHSFDIDHAKAYGIPEAVIIANFQFWIVRNRANGTHQHDGHTWLYNSVKALNTLFPYMSGDQIRRVLDSLEKKHNVLVTGFYSPRAGDRTKWFAFADESQFLPPVDHLVKNPNEGNKAKKGHLAKTPNAFGENPKPFGENPKSTKSTDITADIVTDTSPAELSSEDVFALAWSAYPARPGASKKDSLKQWNARVKAGANPLEILDGVKAYAAYVMAKGTEPEFIKQPATFFGPGEHYRADWTPPKAPTAPVAARAGKFDPNAYVNSGAAYVPSPAPASADQSFVIDAQFVERPA